MRVALSLALRTLAREGRSGDLTVLFLALFVAVMALTGVGFLVDRVDNAMRMQAGEGAGVPTCGCSRQTRSAAPIRTRPRAAALPAATSSPCCR